MSLINQSHSRFASLGIAFGIAVSVFAGACGFAVKYVSDKVDEEKAKATSSEQEVCKGI